MASDLLSLVSSLLNDPESQKTGLREPLALLALCNLLGIVNVLGGYPGRTTAPAAMPGGKDLLSLLNMLPKQGKKIDPQMINSLLSLVGNDKTGALEAGKLVGGKKE